MKIVKRLLATLVSLLIASLIAAWSTLAIIGSATAINQLIVASKGYEVVATQTRTAALSSANIPEQYQATITQAFEKSITEQQIEKIVQPLLVDVVGWLDQPAGTPAPQLVLNLSPLKLQLEAELQQAELTEIEKTALVAQVAKQIPDQIDLAQAQGLAGGQGATTQTPTSASVPEATLVSVKSAYTILQQFALIGLGVLLVLLALMIYLSRKDGRAMLRRPAWSFISAGLLMTLIWLVSRVLPVDQSQQTFVIAMSVAREVTGIVVWYSAASLLVGAALYGLSFLLKAPIAVTSSVPIAAPPTTPISQPQAQATAQPTTNQPEASRPNQDR